MWNKKKAYYVICICLFFLFLGNHNPAFCALAPAEYMCELGVKFYQAGRLDDALQQFKNVLIVDPANETAKKYINKIFSNPTNQTIPLNNAIAPEAIPPSWQTRPSREEAMEQALNSSGKEEFNRKAGLNKKQLFPGLNISGEIQASGGFTSDDAIWKRANADLNEKNWRMLSSAAFDNRADTYDTRIYDRFRLNLDTDNTEGFNFHGNVTVDPWSFTGKASKTTVTGSGGDNAQVELKYWSNTGYTINETVYTLKNGDSFSLPEIKVKDGIVPATTVTSTFGNKITIPEMKIYREFQPLRELWFDYNKEAVKLRFFPIAYQDQALTFDDPLVLSNNHIWWQESPWIDKWLAGRINTGATPVDFTKGRFDDALSYFTRDSDGTRLTALRGMSFQIAPDDKLSLASTFATPKGLWQDYSSVDNVINATRAKYRLLDNLSLGSSFTYRLGLNDISKTDSLNYLWAGDIGYEIIEGLKANLEAAASKSTNDIATEAYKTNQAGNAYMFSVAGAFPRKSIMDLKYGYPEIKPEEGDSTFTKYKFYLARMDKDFNPVLSNYRQTRKDSFWSRHIHFRKPFKDYFTGLYTPSMTWDDIEPFRIGNGIDIDRNVLGLRLENSLFDKKLENLFDIRNVHKTEGKFVENVMRDEATFQATEKLTTKFLGIYQRLPKTTVGKDPFIFDNKTDIPDNNTAIQDGMNPTLKTGSLGLEYAFTKWLALSGIWERTNDSTLAYDNFPRGVLNSSSFVTYRNGSNIYRRDDPFLYSQGLFPLPPYQFYNIWKSGLRIDPMDKLEIYIDYTRNEFKSAGQIDDNINHVGFEVSYLPSKKFGLFFRYYYSRWNDINRMLAGYDKIYLGHHNFFGEFRYYPSADDEFILQYGESGITPVATVSFDPFGGGTSTLDTQHIIRMYYRRKF